MNRQLKIFWIGILLYVVSFFLLAVSWPIPHSSATPGFFCAVWALVVPLREATLSGSPFQYKPFALVFLFVSGLINPVFIATAFLDLAGQYERTVRVLRIVVLAMIPFCWMSFNSFGLYPREGHYVWILGILTVLFSHISAAG